MTPDEARKKIMDRGLYFRAFTDYCRKNGLYIKRGREHFFVDSFVDELAEEWVRKEEVRETFGMGRSRFYELVKEKKWPFLKIGEVLLVKMKKFVRSAKDLNFCVT